MQVVYARCAGLDVHKKTVSACVSVCEAEGGKQRQMRVFGTFTSDLLALADWLKEQGVTHVAMEATGIYWRPVWAVLEGQFQQMLVNPQHIKAVPGRKTDAKDCEWIADLLQHGLLQGSFVPPMPIQDLRDLTRYRAELRQSQNRVANRLQKFLEQANIKLSSVASNALGVSGRQMLEAIIAGQEDAGQLAKLARGKLKNKIAELERALEGRIRDHHRFLLAEYLDEWEALGERIVRLEAEIDKQIRPFEQAVALWQTIPGVDHVTACNLVAEIGVDMRQFPSAQHLASWAALCPGNHESAGKRTPAERGMATSGCGARCAKPPGPSRERRTAICRRSSNGWPGAEASSGLSWPWRTRCSSLATTCSRPVRPTTNSAETTWSESTKISSSGTS